MSTAMRQLDLCLSEVTDPNPREIDQTASLSDWLGHRLGRRVQLTFTRNRTTMLSFRERHGLCQIRLHELFRQAGEREWRALSDYIDGHGREASRIIDAFILAQSPTQPRAGSAECNTRGRFHDLKPIFDELNATYFHGAVLAAISWGSASSRRYRRTIQLGIYLRNEALIRIHPCLDQAFVPRHYVAWVVFHEMLHDVFGIDLGRRRKVHPPEFNAIEQSFPDYARCKAWEQQNLHRLLRFRAT